MLVITYKTCSVYSSICVLFHVCMHVCVCVCVCVCVYVCVDVDAVQLIVGSKDASVVLML